MSKQAFSAKNARVRINENVVFEGMKWSVSATNPDIDTTNFEGDGYSDVIASISSAEVSVEGFFNPVNNPHLIPSRIVEGITLFQVSLYLDAIILPNLRWFFPLVLVVSHDTPGYRDWETDRKSTRLNSSH